MTVLEEDCISLKVDTISIENITLLWTASWRYAPVTNCYVTCGQMIFMTWRYPLNNSDVLWQTNVVCFLLPIKSKLIFLFTYTSFRFPYQNIRISFFSQSFWLSDKENF